MKTPGVTYSTTLRDRMPTVEKKSFCRVARSCAALIGMLLFADAAFAQDAPAAKIPPPLTAYEGRKIARTMHYTGAPWLLRESRQREEDCEMMVKQLGLRPGMTVCDMGCGNGFYTLQLAQLVGENGRTLAVDIQSEMLRLLQARAAEAEITNIETLLGTVIDPKLPSGAIDLILCVDVYHEFSHPQQMLAAMRKSLKPDGVVVLVEFREEDEDVPIKPLHKMSKRQARKELKLNGFKLVRDFDGLPWQHMMFFGRDESWQPANPAEVATP